MCLLARECVTVCSFYGTHSTTACDRISLGKQKLSEQAHDALRQMKPIPQLSANTDVLFKEVQCKSWFHSHHDDAGESLSDVTQQHLSRHGILRAALSWGFSTLALVVARMHMHVLKPADALAVPAHQISIL
jgi:hypothetical protein